MSASTRSAGSARAEFAAVLMPACRALGLALGDDQVERMYGHYALMVQANRRTNLTRITAPAQAAVKHYADSLALLTWTGETIAPDARVLDVGTGAGFPAVPLAICRTAWQILAIDGTRKKTEFVSDAVRSLGLENVSVRHARARELTGRVEPLDLVTCRAVSDPLTCLREMRGLIAPSGWLAHYTTPQVFDDLTDAQHRRARRLGFEPPVRHAYTLTLADAQIDRVMALWRRT